MKNAQDELFWFCNCTMIRYGVNWRDLCLFVRDKGSRMRSAPSTSNFPISVDHSNFHINSQPIMRNNVGHANIQPTPDLYFKLSAGHINCLCRKLMWITILLHATFVRQII